MEGANESTEPRHPLLTCFCARVVEVKIGSLGARFEWEAM